jgi:glutamate-5-semialdehyde dehydrogenase
MSSMRHQAQVAREVSRKLAILTTAERDRGLARMAELVRENVSTVLEANGRDVAAGQRLGPALLDRLRLSEGRLLSVADGLDQVRALSDPLGRETAWRRPNGLLIRKVSVPLGVLAMIYEARPNVTVESASLALKSGNACLLRGSRSAFHSNQALVELLRQALEETDLPANAIQAVEDLSHEGIDELARLRGLVDCLIPRGGAELIRRVVETATVPVIETGVGNCHLYVHHQADPDMALALIVNSKCSRPAVCNSLETVLVDAIVADDFLPRLAATLAEHQVEIRGCPRTCAAIAAAIPASEADWVEEALDLILSVRVVDDEGQALDHIARYGSGHTEAIVTRDLAAARRFQNEVDACCVNVNASTRFTDGGQFGFGAEIGISTQKLHARGPLGLAELTTWKYLVEGEGQVR